MASQFLLVLVGAGQCGTAWRVYLLYRQGQFRWFNTITMITHVVQLVLGSAVGVLGSVVRGWCWHVATI